MKHLAAVLLLLQAAAPPSPVEPLKRLDYFVGTWTFEWTVPDSPFGRGGKITGTETYRKVLDGRFLESEFQADGPWGAFQGKSLMGYNEQEKIYTRYEVDSAGAATLKSGPMGSDAGGWHTFYWETTPIHRSGQTVNLKGATMMYSPVNYRQRVQISVDGGPYTNFGNPWYRKQTGGAAR